MDNLAELYQLNKGNFKFGDKDGKVYEKNMFIPSIIAVLYTDRPEDYDKFDFQNKVVGAFLSCQYENMNAEWVKDNVDLGQQNEIFHKIQTRFVEDQEQLGKSLEAVRPPKKKKR